MTLSPTQIYGNITATFEAKTRQNRAKWKRGYPYFSMACVA
jgi:hypothetical protein